MNYQKLYDSIVIRGKERKLSPDVYSETHHIRPKCMGGTNDKENLVELNAREHFLCHWLLHKIYPDDFLLLAAWNSFCRGTKESDFNPHPHMDRRISSHLYEYCRKAWIVKLKERKHTHPDWWKSWTQASSETIWLNDGLKNYRAKVDEVDFYLEDGWVRGRLKFNRTPHSQETKDKISKANRGKKMKKQPGWYQTETGQAAIANMVATRIAKGEFRSEEQKQKDETERNLRQTRVLECPHCGHKSKPGASEFIMKRWHFDNCKTRESSHAA